MAAKKTTAKKGSRKAGVKSTKKPVSRGLAKRPPHAKKKVAAKKSAAKKPIAKKKAIAKKPIAKKAKKLAPKKAAPKKAAPKKAAAKKAAPKKAAAPRKPALAKPKQATPPPPLHRMDHAGHYDPDYAAMLRRQSGEAPTEDRAFFASPRSGDSLAEELGEEAVSSMTSGEDESDRLEQDVDEDEGGPFVETEASEEFADGVDESNPEDATREPFPTA